MSFKSFLNSQTYCEYCTNYTQIEYVKYSSSFLFILLLSYY